MLDGLEKISGGMTVGEYLMGTAIGVMALVVIALWRALTVKDKRLGELQDRQTATNEKLADVITENTASLARVDVRLEEVARRIP